MIKNQSAYSNTLLLMHRQQWLAYKEGNSSKFEWGSGFLLCKELQLWHHWERLSAMFTLSPTSDLLDLNLLFN